MPHRYSTSLKLRRENDGRKLAVRARETDDNKRLLMAIASKRFLQGVDVVRIGIKRKYGVNKMIHMYDDGVRGVWKPKTYEAVDILRGIAFLRLGGARVAEFAHRTAWNQYSTSELIHSPSYTLTIHAYNHRNRTEYRDMFSEPESCCRRFQTIFCSYAR